MCIFANKDDISVIQLCACDDCNSQFDVIQSCSAMPQYRKWSSDNGLDFFRGSAKTGLELDLAQTTIGCRLLGMTPPLRPDKPDETLSIPTTIEFVDDPPYVPSTLL